LSFLTCPLICVKRKAGKLETEKSTVTFARELERGGYKIVATEELIKWIYEKTKAEFLKHLDPDEKRLIVFYLRFQQVHPQPQRGHLGGQARI
jgi:hypothetical protein